MGSFKKKILLSVNQRKLKKMALGLEERQDNMEIDTPTDAGRYPMKWCSDAVAGLLRDLGIRFIALNPGASFRSLHDSIVNYLGNKNPQLLLTLHEEHAVAMAHGYAKVTGEPMAVLVHSNVGLMHATMPIFNAWCDRAPVMVLGATGPVDANLRRPWIDWIHTSKDQGVLVRDYTKWDDQPGSAPAALESVMRAYQICRTAPCGPVYICFDTTVQDETVEKTLRFPDVSRFMPASAQYPAPESIGQAAKLLLQSKKPLIMIGRNSRSQKGWDNRVKLAETIGAEVLTDLKVGAGFPTQHPLNSVAPGEFLSPDAIRLIKNSDVILSLDWIDLGGSLKRVWSNDPVEAKIIHCSVDCFSHKAWSADYQGLAPVDHYILSTPELFVESLLAEIAKHKADVELREGYQKRNLDRSNVAAPYGTTGAATEGPIDARDIAICFNKLLREKKTTIVRVPIGWPGDLLVLKDSLDFLGGDGGGGLGAGPGMAIGAALALKGSGRIPVAILGDGDFLMGITALWTAAHYRIPVLIIVMNNRSYGNSENHQKVVAKQRGRSIENNWIGTKLEDPFLGIAELARAQGFKAGGPVANLSDLSEALETGISEVEKGAGFVLDIIVSG